MDFVEDWSIAQTLGEGAYGEVKLLINKKTNECVAMKTIDISKCPEIAKEVKKEVAIHRLLKDSSVIRFYGTRTHDNIEYLFLEYAPHGELFDRIEPDVGMPISDAHKYMGQLLAGVEYLHDRGIAHRDIKPENLLLDEHDNLKISDFGLATVFRAKGKERPLDKKCGTLPYVAPEVLSRPYAAQPADIWSCGIVLVAMLAGELPWDCAEDTCADYRRWKVGNYTRSTPWCKVDTLSLALLLRVLAHLPSTRYTVLQIRNHRWFNQNHTEGQLPEEVKKKLRMVAQNNGSLSQEILASSINKDNIDSNFGSEFLFLSQPVRIDDMLVSTQMLNTQSTSAQNCMQKLVKRMTRFYVKLTMQEAFNEVTSILDKLTLSWKTSGFPTVTVNTIDKRKTNLIFKCNILENEHGTLMDFRLSRGCGLEFKRQFVLIRSALCDVIIPNPI